METIFDTEARIKLQKHYTIKQASDICAVSVKSLYRYIYDGRIKAHKIGGSIRIPKSELLNLIQPLN